MSQGERLTEFRTGTFGGSNGSDIVGKVYGVNGEVT